MWLPLHTLNLMFFYVAYGLTLKSNLSIPGLHPTSKIINPDVVVNLKYPLDKIFAQPNWEQNIYNITFDDGTVYLINHQATEIWANWHEDESLESAVTYLKGAILGFILSLRGITCLHAAAVVINGNAVVFMGDSSAGKSTLAATFAKNGFAILSDDIVAITTQDDHFMIQPAYPRVRLWSNSVIALYDNAEALPRIAPLHPTWDKRYLDLTKLGLYQSQPLKLSAIYLIGDRQLHNTPRVELMGEKEKMIHLIRNTYASYEFDQKMQIKDFQVFGEMLKKVTIKKLISHTNTKYLDKLCDVILGDLKIDV